MADGKVTFEITATNDGVKTAIDDTTKQLESAGKTWEGSAENSGSAISGSLIGAFKAVVASAAFVKIANMLYKLGMESINVASDLQEVQNVVDTTFGSSGAARIEAWAKSAQSQFGLTELQAKQFASTLGAMMKSSGMTGPEIEDMSMAMAGLAADMASFYNLDYQTAFDKIRAGIAGEVEPLRQLGINMSVANLEAFAMAQGIDTAFSDMSQAEQTLLRYQYLMAATADAQGDFAKTSDGYANSQRRITTGLESLKAALGEILLPIATQISDAVADFLELLTMPPEKTVFEEAGEEMGDAASNAASAIGLLNYLEKLQERYGDAATQTGEWATALERLRKVFPDINQYIDSETGALKATNDELKLYIEQMKQAAIERAKQNAIQTLMNQYGEATVQYGMAQNEYEINTAEADAQFGALLDYVISSGIEEAKKNAERLGEEFNLEDFPLLDKDYWLEGFKKGEISMDDLLNEALNLAYQRGDNTDILKSYAEAYKAHSEAAAAAKTEMETLSVTMTNLESQIAIAEGALARMATQAGAAASTLETLAGTTFGSAGGGGTGLSGGSVYKPVFFKKFKTGLDYVPYDDYFAMLHEGEAVLTAEENRVWQDLKRGAGGMDYGTLGSVMKDNVNASGDVYLEGEIVGRIMSRTMGNSYRRLGRSGWRG